MLRPIIITLSITMMSLAVFCCSSDNQDTQDSKIKNEFEELQSYLIQNKELVTSYMSEESDSIQSFYQDMLNLDYQNFVSKYELSDYDIQMLTKSMHVTKEIVESMHSLNKLEIARAKSDSLAEVLDSYEIDTTIFDADNAEPREEPDTIYVSTAKKDSSTLEKYQKMYPNSTIIIMDDRYSY